VTRPSSRDLLRFFLWLGTTGFGGPIALVGYMEHEFVDRRRWVTRQELNDGLAFSQLAPGPLAAQLAIYLGWLCRGARGATVAGIAFVAPSFAMVLVLAALYQRLGGIPWLQGAFYGIGAAVIAIIARSAVKLVRTTLGSDRLMWVLFAASALVTAWTESEIVWVFALCGVVSVLASTSSRLPGRWVATAGPIVGTFHVPSWLVATLEGAGGTSLVMIGALFVYFASAGLFVFGSGLAIVPFLHGGVVQQHHWLTERQFLDAVAVALITPGPVVITVAFSGYLVAGTLGATAAAMGVFAPVYVITLVLAPRYERLKADRRVRAFVNGVTAAATGAIAGAAVVLGRRAVVDVTTAAIATITLLVLLRTRKVPEPLVVVSAGVAGVLAASFNGA
jgi:chromate transporter